jgi:hypothetical protein
VGFADLEYACLSRDVVGNGSSGASLSLLSSSLQHSCCSSQREVPVVGWVRSFLVFGVIDEIERREFPIPPPAASTLTSKISTLTSQPSVPPVTLSSAKGKGKKAAPPATPEKDPQLTLKQFFSSVPSPSKKGKEKAVDQDAPPETIMGSREEAAEPTVRTGFVLSDTKTR